MNEAPQGTAFTFGVYFLITGAPLYDAGNLTKPLEFCDIQFSLFSDTASGDSILTAYTELTARFDECALTVDGYAFIRMHRIGQRLVKDSDQNWHYIVEYRIIIEKT